MARILPVRRWSGPHRRPHVGFEADLPSVRPSMRGVYKNGLSGYQLDGKEPWLEEVLAVESTKRNGHESQANTGGEAPRSKYGRPRLPSYPRDVEGKGAGLRVAGGASQQDATRMRELGVSVPGLRMPEPVHGETWGALRAAPFNLPPPSHLAVFRGNFPGALPPPGAVESSTEDNGGQLANAFTTEGRDSADLSRGFGMLTGAEVKGVLRAMVALSDGIFVGHLFDATPMSVDTLMLGVNLFALYVGTTDATSFDSLAQEEVQLLPAACLLAAYKFEEDACSILPRMIEVLVGDGRSRAATKRQLVALESKMLQQTGFRLMTPTAVTFLHLILQRTVCEGELGWWHTPAVGATATDIVWGLVSDGFGGDYSPSDIAAAAVYCAARHEYGPQIAADVATVVGCKLHCPMFQRLCRGVETSSGGKISVDARAQVMTGVGWDNMDQLNIGKAAGGCLSGDSDTDGITPPPSAEVPGQPAVGFFTEGQDLLASLTAGHNANRIASPDASERKFPPGPGRQGQAAPSPPGPPEDVWAPSRMEGIDEQTLFSSPNCGELSPDGVHISATPELEHVIPSPTEGYDEYDVTEGDTLPTIGDESRESSVDPAAHVTPLPPVTDTAVLSELQSRPGREDFIWNGPTDFDRVLVPPEPFSSPCAEDYVGADPLGDGAVAGTDDLIWDAPTDLDRVLLPPEPFPSPCAEDYIGADSFGEGVVASRLEVDTHLQRSQHESPLDLPRLRQAGAETTSSSHDVVGEVGADSPDISVIEPVFLNLLTPAEVLKGDQNGDGSDWLRTAARDLDLPPLSWTGGGLLIPHRPWGAE